MKPFLKYNLFLIFISIFSFVCNAQTKTELQAIALYNKAETAYNNASYEEALDNLTQAETLLGKTNSKLLYLKIQTLNLLSKADSKKTTDLQRAIAQFYQETDQNTYPAEKYLAVTTIELEIKNAIAAEEKDYNKTKGSNNITDYDNFFSTYPGSKHEADLKPKYNELLAQKKLAEQKAASDQWKEKNLPLLRKYRGGKAMIGFGSVFLAGGLAMVGAGTGLMILNEPGLYEWDGYSHYHFANEYITQQEFDEIQKKYTMGLGLASAGGALVATGVILVAIGPTYLHKSIKLKKEAKDKGIDLTYMPTFTPVTNRYGVSITMNF